MKIIDSYPEILTLIAGSNRRFDIIKWDKYAESISPALSGKCKAKTDHYSFVRDLLPVLNQAYIEAEKLETAHRSFLQAMKGLEDKVMSKTGTDLDAVVVFYIGLCNGAGWADELDGNPTVLLGAEKIIELGWYGLERMAALIYHEIGHLWHKAVGLMDQKTNDCRDEYILQLYQEGIAMHFEQLMMDDFGYYHQNDTAWRGWCKTNERRAAAEYLRRLNTQRSCQDFFGDWCSFEG
ncbi:MAG: hypothetical protein LBS19_09785, partial [Clostridiales bacterium]|nr:hypothetical protein [Clostridiales bacterium]